MIDDAYIENLRFRSHSYNVSIEVLSKKLGFVPNLRPRKHKVLPSPMILNRRIQLQEEFENGYSSSPDSSSKLKKTHIPNKKSLECESVFPEKKECPFAEKVPCDKTFIEVDISNSRNSEVRNEENDNPFRKKSSSILQVLERKSIENAIMKSVSKKTLDPPSNVLNFKEIEDPELKLQEEKIFEGKENIISKAKRVILKREMIRETRKLTKIIDFKPIDPKGRKSLDRIRRENSKVDLNDTPYQKLRNFEDRKKIIIMNKIKDSVKVNSGLKLQNQYKTVDNNNFYLEIVNQLPISGEIKYCPTISSIDPNLTVHHRKGSKQPKLFFNHINSDRTRNNFKLASGNADFLLNVFTPKKRNFSKNFKDISLNSTEHLSIHFQLTEDKLPMIHSKNNNLLTGKLSSRNEDAKALTINSADNIEYVFKK